MVGTGTGMETWEGRFGGWEGAGFAGLEVLRGLLEALARRGEGVFHDDIFLDLFIPLFRG